MAHYQRKLVITGGAGFIGSHLVRRFVKNYPEYHIINLDKLTYAGNLENLTDIEEASNYTFVKGDVADLGFLRELFEKYKPDGVIHCAAESHVDRSILDPLSFVVTNVNGTVSLLQVAKEAWKGDMDGKTFYHISTDEVYGELGDEGFFREDTPYSPRSPYSASKASSDHFVRAYYHTFGLPVVISNCSNNYGPYQFPEKLIPLMINNILHDRPLPVYGKGENIRDWLYVEDHVEAIDRIFHSGKVGETYNIGGDNEWKNIDLVKLLCTRMDEALDKESGHAEGLITYVKDRAGHDLRYAIDAGKIKADLGWEPKTSFEEGLRKTVSWYLSNRDWASRVLSGEYQQYYRNQYELR